MGGPGREPQRGQRQHDRRRVGEHVGRVRQQGQGVRQQADDDLCREVAADQGQRDRQPAAVGVRCHIMPVTAVAIRMMTIRILAHSGVTHRSPSSPSFLFHRTVFRPGAPAPAFASRRTQHSPAPGSTPTIA